MTRDVARLRALDARILVLANSTSNLIVQFNELKCLRERVRKEQQVIQQPHKSPFQRCPAQVELRS